MTVTRRTRYAALTADALLLVTEIAKQDCIQKFAIGVVPPTRFGEGLLTFGVRHPMAVGAEG